MGIAQRGCRGRLSADVVRGDELVKIDMHLDSDWRCYVDISWRTTTGVLRRSLLGGIEYRDVSAEDCETLGVSKNVIALKATRGASRTSGEIRRDDVIVAVDGKDKYMSEGDLIAYFAQEKKRGDEIQITVLRAGERIDIKLPVTN